MMFKSPTNLALSSQPNLNLRVAVNCFDVAAGCCLNRHSGLAKRLSLASTYADDGAFESAIDIANAVHAQLQQRRRPDCLDVGEIAIDLIIVGLVALKEERGRRSAFYIHGAGESK